MANDADGQRCNLLAHQTKRICSPALLVTNHDATQYPVVYDHALKVCDPPLCASWWPGFCNRVSCLSLSLTCHKLLQPSAWQLMEAEVTAEPLPCQGF